MALVCGVDCGSLKTPNWVAWLENGQFILDAYIPNERHPLPSLPMRSSPVQCYAFAAPQGLPVQGETTRECDRLANNEARRLPTGRQEMEQWRECRGLIEVGVSVFWWAHEQRLGSIVGLPPVPARSAAVCETAPRYVARRMWPGLEIPSEQDAPLMYIDAIYAAIQKLGYVCRSIVRPTVGQVNAMVCAVAAHAFVEAEDLPAGSVGEGPWVDHDERLLRGGYIVSP